MRAQMLDSTQLQTAHQTLKNLTVKFDGPLFEMGGGSAQLAVGVEYLDYTMREELSRERGTGPASTNSFTTFLDFDRDVTSEFVELLLPIVGASNSMRGVREFTLNLSARHDDYSDFGSTSNPRFGLNWSPINALQDSRELRGILHRAGAHEPRRRQRRHGGVFVRRFAGCDGVRRERQPRDTQHLPGRDRLALAARPPRRRA